MRARVVAAAALCLLAAGGCHKKKAFRVAAAADLQLAFQEVAVAFKAQGGATPSFTFGSSGLLAKQVAEGAPFDLFASGNTGYVDQVVAAGACDAATKSAYARGRLVAWTPPGGPAPPTTLADLADPRFKRIAIANPEHAPYGQRAEEALRHAGLWPAIRPHLVLGENISQAAQFATSGSTQGGIVALSLALAPDVAKLGDFALIPEAWHRPLLQRMVLLKGAPPPVREFHDYLSTTAAQAIMVRYGFATPRD